jgi:tRNA A37 threonylcarbamoyladenosine modification protein TsaB
MAPVARVESRKGQRKGRGFSAEEIKKAGLTIELARKLKVAVDARRKSVYDSNVAQLKKLELPEKKPKAKKAARAPKAKKAAKGVATKVEKKVKAPAKKPAPKAKAKPKKAAPKKPAKKKAAPKKK